MRLQREFDTALAAVREASLVCRAVQQELRGAVLQKDDRSPVTVADFASQALICRVLQEAFAADPVVGEEDADALRDDAQRALLAHVVQHVRQVRHDADDHAVCAWIDHGNGAPGSRFWTLDPIDGTKGFLRGEQYAVALALIVDGQVQVAAMGCPNLPATPGGAGGAIFTAVRGQGARCVPLEGGDAVPIHVSTVSEPERLRWCESVESGHSSHGRAARVAQRLGTRAEPVRMDSQAKYGVVARGEAEAYLRFSKGDYREKIWDHAAGYLVCTEAGGRASDLQGRPLDFGRGRLLDGNQGVIVTNGALHDAVLAAVAATSE